MLVAAAFAVVAPIGPSPQAVAAEVDFPVGLSDPSILKVHEGTIEVTEDGTVIENLELRGTLRIEAEDVVVRNVWVYTTAQWTVYVASGSATLERMEIGHPDIIGERGIGGSNLRASGLDIHSVEDGIKLGSNAHYTNVYVHDLDSAGDKPHFDAVQADGGAMGASVTDSVLSSIGPRGIGNAAVFLKTDLGPIADITIANSYLEGGNYMNSVRDGGNGDPTGVVFRDNRVGETFRYGVTRFNGEVVWAGNVWDTSGVPVEPGDKEPPPATTTTTSTTTTTTSTTTTTTTMPPSTTTTMASEASGSDTTMPPTTTAADTELAAPEDASVAADGNTGIVAVAAVVALIALAALAIAFVRARAGGAEATPEDSG